MRYSYYPVNLEAELGPSGALMVSCRLVDVPTGASAADFDIWAARTPSVLSPSNLEALATGTLDIASLGALRQRGIFSGLRKASGLSLSPLGDFMAVEGSLYNPATDMQLKTPMSPSHDTIYDASRDRSDGPWLIAVTCRTDAGVVIATGGLGQMKGQEHLAAVWLMASPLAPSVEIGHWLEATLKDLVPALNWRMAQVTPRGADWSIKEISYSDEAKKGTWPVVYIVPQRETQAAEGISAPDRRLAAEAFTIRAISYSDNPSQRKRSLEQLSGSITQLLNTKTYREAVLPSGVMFNLAYATDIEYGHTEDGWDDAVDITWSCQYIPVGLF